jgi:Family of unknown function (DUF6519)/IPT/TIG domain
MGGDRARVSYDPSRKWRGLIAQQGRVTVEADWNEAAAIDRDADRLRTLDIVGPFGTPDQGYGITSAPAGGTPGDLIIGPGTLYLGGERLDLDAPVTYSAQPDWLDFSTDPLWVPPAVPGPGASPNELVYLLASEQEVSAVEDPALADVALGGPDTMQRQRILQHFVRQPTQASTCADAWTVFVSSLAARGLEFDPDSAMIGSAAGLQVSFTTTPGPPSPCQPVATGGYLGAENQMIRVMIASVDNAGVPTVVWGFDDASFLYQVTAATFDSGSGNTTITLASAPVDSFHYPVAGQAVELLRDAAELVDTGSAASPAGYIASPSGFVAPVATSYDPTLMQLTISGQAPADYLTAATPQLYLRVWQATVAAPNKVATQLGTTGVAVTLTSDTTFHVGDFWCFAVRPIQPAIAYPARYLEAAQPPDGPRTWACPLAVLAWSAGTATATACVPPFADLVALTTAEGGCCTVTVGPRDVDEGALLQTLIESYANQGAVTVCLRPGTYTLPAPLVFGPELNGITLQGCQGAVFLQAESNPGDNFLLGLIALRQVNSATIRGIELAAPLVGFSPPPNSFSGLPTVNLTLLEQFSTGLQVAIGLSADNAAGLTIEDCTFDFPDPGQSNALGAGIFATGVMTDVEIKGCTFGSANPPGTVLFNDLSVGNPVAPPYQLSFGYLQVPDATVPAGTQLLHDAAIERCLFQGLTVSALVTAQLGTLRVDRNTVRNTYGGFWLVSLADPTQSLIFSQFTVGDATAYQQFATVGVASLRDGIFVIATAIGQTLPATPPPPPALAAVSGPVAQPAPRTALQGPGAPLRPVMPVTLGFPRPLPEVVSIPFADPGTGVSLRLDCCDCQVDAVIAGSYSGAGLLVMDLTPNAGSVVCHGNRIRNRFPGGETALIAGVAEASITGNVVANEVPAVTSFHSSTLITHSIVLNPVNTPVGAVLAPPPPALGGAAVAVTGNVFIDGTLLPTRVGIQADLTDWDVLNTVTLYGSSLPAVTSLNLAGGTASGGTTVTVNGTGFTAATAVNFGPGNPGTIVNVTDGSLTVTSPACPPGGQTVDVTVTTPLGTSPAVSADQFTYLQVTGVNPPQGPTTGGITVTVSGSGFTGATTVNFGPGNPGTGVLVVPDGTQLIVTSPAGGGTVDVTVTTPLGTSPVVPADHFTYTKPPKEGKDKEKDQKDVKDKDKEKDKEKELLRDKVSDKVAADKLRDSRPVQPFATPRLGQQAAGLEDDSAPDTVGRAFIRPDERPAVGSNVLNDDEQDLS